MVIYYMSHPPGAGTVVMVLQIQDRALQEKLIGYSFLVLMGALVALLFYKGIMIF